ncbi:MAG TPA: PAS domain-containing protein, partial [Saprospiraceae bacterium]|nr:PAS domain-containing protein [Saprospiraceae bacterium]
MPIFAAILSPGGITLRLNENVVKITDAPLVELLNVPFGSAFWWNYSPEIMSRVENSLAQARQGQGSRFEIAARISQHVFITVDYTLTPVLDDKGKVLYLFACGTDISANKRNEAALRDSEEMLALATESA